MIPLQDLDRIDAVVYGDAFDCAVTLNELWRFSRVQSSMAELREHLAGRRLRAIVAEHDGFYVLNGRDELTERRAQSRRRAERLRRRARRVSRWLQHAPFVRGIVLTGSVAAAAADERADVDLLIIVAAGRLSTVFALLGALSRVLSRRFCCPNYYLSRDHLAVHRRDHYVARELAQAEPLAGDAEAFFAANRWMLEQLPNAELSACTVKPLRGGRWLQWLLEWPLAGRFGDRVEARAHRLARARLSAHHRPFGSAVPDAAYDRLAAGVELRFHGAPRVKYAIDRYEARRAELACLLGAPREVDG